MLASMIYLYATIRGLSLLVTNSLSLIPLSASNKVVRLTSNHDDGDDDDAADDDLAPDVVILCRTGAPGNAQTRLRVEHVHWLSLRSGAQVRWQRDSIWGRPKWPGGAA
jgi:hypothetical protein